MTHDFWCDSLLACDILDDDSKPELPCNCYGVGQVAPTSDVVLCAECISSPCQCKLHDDPARERAHARYEEEDSAIGYTEEEH